jgi:hypothetical protein
MGPFDGDWKLTPSSIRAIDKGGGFFFIFFGTRVNLSVKQIYVYKKKSFIDKLTRCKK